MEQKSNLSCSQSLAPGLNPQAGFKVDHDDYFYRPGFLHIIICVFTGYKASNFVKKLDVTDVLKISKFEGFDRESRPRPFLDLPQVSLISSHA